MLDILHARATAYGSLSVSKATTLLRLASALVALAVLRTLIAADYEHYCVAMFGVLSLTMYGVTLAVASASFWPDKAPDDPVEFDGTDGDWVVQVHGEARAATRQMGHVTNTTIAFCATVMLLLCYSFVAGWVGP